MQFIRGEVQHYVWGDTTTIPEMLGIEPDGRPWAEWWLGTHPAAPSTLDDDTTLASAVGDLPYLVKVLAAARPLSLQTHPDSVLAAAGFAREQESGVSLDDPRRLYKDPFAKPELVIALTSLEALCGFRPVGATVALLHAIGAEALAEALAADGLAATVEGLFDGRLDAEAALDSCAGRHEPEAILAARLARDFPGDPSVAVTLLLHRVVLGAGEALYLAPGNLHAYVGGIGVEVMGSSDNVVRGGMTSKHVDVAELLHVVRFQSVDDPRAGTSTAGGVTTYSTPGAPFLVHRHDASVGHVLSAVGPDLVLCTEGTAGPLTAGTCAVLAAGETLETTTPCVLWQVSPAN